MSTSRKQRATRPRPSLLWRAFVVLGLGTMAAVTVDDRAWERFRNATGDAVSRDQVRQLLLGTLAVHAGESLLAFRRARRSGVGHPLRWSLATMVWGFPVLRRLRKAGKLAAGNGSVTELVGAGGGDLAAAA